jgi:hypothetical protein
LIRRVNAHWQTAPVNHLDLERRSLSWWHPNAVRILDYFLIQPRHCLAGLSRRKRSIRGDQRNQNLFPFKFRKRLAETQPSLLHLPDEGGAQHLSYSLLMDSTINHGGIIPTGCRGEKVCSRGTPRGLLKTLPLVKFNISIGFIKR